MRRRKTVADILLTQAVRALFALLVFWGFCSYLRYEWMMW